MKKRLTGRVAVVTGSGRGIGRAEALALATEGANIVVNDLPDEDSKHTAEEVVDEIKKHGGEAVANCDSVTTPEGGENIIRTAIDRFGRLDILVNNAGILRDRMIFNMTEEEWDAVIKVNLYGHFHCTKPACILFRQQRYGRIINTSSIAGLGNIAQANYSAAKEGIVGFTRTVARDMGKYGTTCNAIRPMAATRLTVDPEQLALWEKSKAANISGTGMTQELEKMAPEHVAPLVVYLAMEEAAHINGRIFYVWGREVGLYQEPELQTRVNTDGIWTVDKLANALSQLLNRK